MDSIAMLAAAATGLEQACRAAMPKQRRAPGKLNRVAIGDGATAAYLPKTQSSGDFPNLLRKIR